METLTALVKETIVSRGQLQPYPPSPSLYKQTNLVPPVQFVKRKFYEWGGSLLISDFFESLVRDTKRRRIETIHPAIVSIFHFSRWLEEDASTARVDTRLFVRGARTSFHAEETQL